MSQIEVLFICTHNSARSQIAEGYLRFKKDSKYNISSAGTDPTRVNPFAVKVMKEIGIDISNHTSKHVNEFLNRQIDYVVTVCDSAKESCPYFPNGKKYLHMSFPDPSQSSGTDEEVLNTFRDVRDQIISWINSYFF